MCYPERGACADVLSGENIKFTGDRNEAHSQPVTDLERESYVYLNSKPFSFLQTTSFCF